MGDTPPTSQPTGDFSNLPQGVRPGNPQSSGQGPYSEIESRRGQQASSSQSSQTGYLPMQAYPPQQHIQHARPEGFNMTTLGNALPDLTYQGYGQVSPQRYPPGPASSGVLYQIQNAPQYTGAPNISPSSTTYNMPYPSHYQGMYGAGHTASAQHLQPGAAPGGQFYHNQGFLGQPQQQGSQYLIQPNQYAAQGQIYGGTSSQYGMRSSFSGDSRLGGQQRSSEYLVVSASGPAGRSNSIASSAGQSSIVRGPPRKPRQSGHAIWIGNLPPQTDLMSLVLHVCKEASALESLFLISKSNCAFANFKDEASCAAAQAKIHDSKFQTVRLVSRLRRSSVGTASGVAVPTGPAALTPPSNAAQPRTPSPEESDSKPVGTGESSTTLDQETDGVALPKDKFFVVKSLTVEDLELSVRNGIWATQSHNEEALNKAYQTTDNVYLIFSANKSGEYFGYARMSSQINDDPAAAIEFAPKAQAVEDPELPKAIPTPATESAPKGRIIDDSARGTIFWEAEREEGDEEDEAQSNKSDQDSDSAPASKAWGKPFKIEWVSTNRLPFYRTRGLRNPWNSNREVKIARDGTELETAIGRRLVGLFHRPPEQPVTQSLAQMHGVPMPLMGYPSVRPFQ